MTIDFYLMPASGPCRAVNLVAEALGIAGKIQKHKSDLTNGKQLKSELIKYPQFYGNKPEEGSLEKLQGALGFLNTFLDEQQYVAGDNLTIADLSLVATVSTIDVAGLKMDEYPNIVHLGWYESVKSTAPNYVEANEEPLLKMKALIESKIKSVID